MASKKLYNFDEEKKKSKKTKKQKAKKKMKKSSNQIDLDNEIIIGVTMKESGDPKYKKKKEKKNKKSKKVNKVPNKKAVQRNTQIYSEDRPNRGINKTIIKWTSIVILVIGLIVLTMLSPIFNLKEIIVTGNEVVSSEKIIGMSDFKIGSNIFRASKKNAKNNIKKSGYIKGVDIKIKVPDKLEIIVTERKAQFIIQYGNAYVVLDNQGYIMEISEEIKPVPFLIGTTTKEENYKENNRLENDDLLKLTNAIRIYNISKTNGIENLITSIDISDEEDYIINFGEQGKVAHLGNCSNIGTRISWVKAILEKTEGPGEIMVNMNLSIENPYFRAKID